MSNNVRARWWWVLDALRQTNPTVEMLLRRARLDTVTAEEITVSWPWRFHQDTMNHPKRRLLAEGVMAEVLGRPYRLRCVVRDDRALSD